MPAPLDRTTTPATTRGPAVRLVVLAVAFVALFLVTTVASSAFAAGAMPLPNAAAAQTRDWFAANPLAAVTGGVLQVLSVGCLAAFAAGLGAIAAGPHRVAVRRAAPLAYLAAGLMAVSSVTSWILAGVASSASLDAVAALRTASFVAGGTAHVAALGLFVLLASRTPLLGRFLRVAAVVVVVVAVLSLLSLVVFQASALILAGRLLSMAWIVGAAVTVARRRDRATSGGRS